MCDLCHMSACPPRCPSYDGGGGGAGVMLGRCVLCDTAVHTDERVLSKNGVLLCGDCADEISLEDLLDIEGVAGSGELLYECLGWR